MSGYQFSVNSEEELRVSGGEREPRNLTPETWKLDKTFEQVWAGRLQLNREP